MGKTVNRENRKIEKDRAQVSLCIKERARGK